MVVHILNIDAITTVSADPADTLFGEYAVPDIHLGTTIDQLRKIPGALQALVTEQLDAQGVLTWASSDEERVKELVGALSALEPSELARIGRLAIWILASVASQPTVLEQPAGKTDEDLLRLAAVATAFARQERAISDLESLLQSDHPESTYQTFFEEQHLDVRFPVRWALARTADHSRESAGPDPSHSRWVRRYDSGEG